MSSAFLGELSADCEMDMSVVDAVVTAAGQPTSPFTIVLDMSEPNLSAVDGTKVWVEWFDSLTSCREYLEKYCADM